MKIALVHDWLTGVRGGERVLDHLVRRFPEAELHTLVHARGRTTPAIEARGARTSPLGRLPGIERHYRKLLPLFPWAIQRFDFSGYDLILSTSHAVAKGVRVPPGVVHVCYCFTPMRYVWDQADAYLGRGARRRLATPLVAMLRRFDVATSDPRHVTRFVAISHEVADRIHRHYARDASVLAPPVDVSWIEPAREPAEDFYLMVGGFVPYKNEALAVEAFRRLGRRLVIVGDGPGRAAIARGAPDHVELPGRVSDAELASLYRRARALIHPQLEDFGLTAVEAQAAGRPVIALGRGGALDTVCPLDPSVSSTRVAADEPATGVFFDEPTADSLAEAVERFEKAEPRFDGRSIRRWAEGFSPARFDAGLDREIARAFEDVS